MVRERYDGMVVRLEMACREPYRKVSPVASAGPPRTHRLEYEVSGGEWREGFSPPCP